MAGDKAANLGIQAQFSTLEEEVEVVGDLRRREGAPERGLEVPDRGGGCESYGGGPPVEGSNLELPLLLRHRDATGAARPPRSTGDEVEGCAVFGAAGAPAGGFGAARPPSARGVRRRQLRCRRWRSPLPAA